MFAVRHDLQIFNAVVAFVAVDVMNVLIRAKFAPQMLLHQIAMQLHFDAVDFNAQILCLDRRGAIGTELGIHLPFASAFALCTSRMQAVFSLGG